MKRAFIYARQSVGDQDVSESVEIQIQHCKELAKANKLEVIEVFKDLNISGKLYPSGFEDIAGKDLVFQEWLKDKSSSKTSRPGLGKLLKRISEADTLIVDDFTRLCRPLTGSFLEAFITQIFTINQVKILTVKAGSIDLQSFQDNLILSLQNRINDNQLKIQREKAIDSMKKMRDSGELYPSLCTVFGYRSTGRKLEVELIPEKVPVVKYIFSEFMKGTAVNEINRCLKEKFNCVMPRQSIRNILRNPIYSGYQKNSNGELVKSKQAYHQRFIPFDNWKKAVELFDSRKAGHSRKRKHFNPFNRYAVCGKCGTKMAVRSPGNTKFNIAPMMVCSKSEKYRQENCSVSLSLSKDIPEGLGLLEAVKPFLAIGALQNIKEHTAQVNFKAELESLDIELQNLIKKEKKLTALYTSGQIDDDPFTESIKNLSEEKKKIKLKQAELSTKISSQDSIEKAMAMLRKVIAGTVTEGEYELLLKQSVKLIRVFKDHVSIDTVLGTVDLPRKHISKYTLLPRYSFAVNKGIVDLYFYHGKQRVVAPIYSKYKKQVLKTKEFNVYIIAD